MSSLFLTPANFSQLATALDSDKWVVACLCAAWCDVCKQYRAGFDAVAAQHPDQQFVWIDIEDQADLVGDLDVENFPTILMQRGDTVAFYGTMLPEPRQLARLLQAQMERPDAELLREAGSTPERQQWQRECNLRARLAELPY
jgi:thioredoxin-like negative regulator of GroEL